LTWVKDHPDDHSYNRPVEGLIALVDLDTMEVLRVDDYGVTPLPPKTGNYTPDALTNPDNVPYFPDGLRKDVRPLTISQPEGSSFQVDGHTVRWQKWSFRIGFTPREGLVLYTIGYEDGGRVRPILYRASLSELFIPYGDPHPTHYRKQVFDMGEYGIGKLANSLALGCDCLGEIRYFDGVINNSDGEPVTIRNAICLHEEDYGILWKHTGFRTGKVEVRRSRRLVVSSIMTVGNYDYGFFWYFYQDGTIQYEAKLTGVISNGAIAPGEKPTHGTLVAPGVYGPNHQHFFNVRLDLMVDGPNNTVYEVNSEAVPRGEANPHGNAWITTARPLTTEAEAQRTVNPLSARYWTIANPSVHNGVGEPVAYKLMPGDNVLPFSQPDAHAITRAGFATKHLWVTPYHPDERYAAGDYPNQHPGGAGLPAYTAANRSLENTDVVLWYTFGAHHVPRPEEWPVMPVAYIGFHLKPLGFFDGNPALDVPPARPAHGDCCDTPRS
jgi:primary-amine oxidase